MKASYLEFPWVGFIILIMSEYFGFPSTQIEWNSACIKYFLILIKHALFWYQGELCKWNSFGFMEPASLEPLGVRRHYVPHFKGLINDQWPKGTKTEWNSEPLKILKKLKVLSRNWTYDFKKDRKNIFYDKILKF